MMSDKPFIQSYNGDHEREEHKFGGEKTSPFDVCFMAMCIDRDGEDLLAPFIDLASGFTIPEFLMTGDERIPISYTVFKDKAIVNDVRGVPIKEFFITFRRRAPIFGITGGGCEPMRTVIVGYEDEWENFSEEAERSGLAIPKSPEDSGLFREEVYSIFVGSDEIPEGFVPDPVNGNAPHISVNMRTEGDVPRSKAGGLGNLSRFDVVPRDGEIVLEGMYEDEVNWKESEKRLRLGDDYLPSFYHRMTPDEARDLGRALIDAAEGM